MKKEWKLEELRQTSEQIRAAVMPKSITPEMVGGTLAGLTDALDEVVGVLGDIPREHVKVIVMATDGERVVSTAGATVWLDMFNVPGFPATVIPRQQLTCDDNGEVEFDVPHGFSYALFSQVAGLGASFQFVYHAATEGRTIRLFNLPIGILSCCITGYYKEGESVFATYPVPFHTVVTDIENDSHRDLWHKEGWELCSYGCEEVVVVSTAETSFAIEPGNLAPELMPWSSGAFLNDATPTLPEYGDSLLEVDLDAGMEAARIKVSADFDGNMNTAKIIAVDNGVNAASWCASRSLSNSSGFLPSTGQLLLMLQNRTAINAMMTALTEQGVTYSSDFTLLPYQSEDGKWSNFEEEAWLSSTCLYKHFVSAVNMESDACPAFKAILLSVRAVSAVYWDKERWLP